MEEETLYTTRAWYPGTIHEYARFDPDKVHRMISTMTVPGPSITIASKIKEGMTQLKGERVPGDR